MANLMKVSMSLFSIGKYKYNKKLHMSLFQESPRFIADDNRGGINGVVWNSDGTYILSYGQDRTIRLYNPHREDPSNQDRPLLIKSYQGPHSYEITSVVVSKENSTMVSSGGDRAFFLWDVATGNIIRRFHGHSQRVNVVSLNKLDSVVVSGML